MVNRPKRKGTAAETAVVTYFRGHGWPYAERRSLQGSLDKGDVTGCPGLCIEVKAAATLQLAAWLEETAVETVNAGADYGVLVMKPPGIGVTRMDRWLTAMDNGQFQRLVALPRSPELSIVDAAPVQYTNKNLHQGFVKGLAALGPDQLLALTLMPPGSKTHSERWYRVLTLQHMVNLLRAVGYGDPVISGVDA